MAGSQVVTYTLDGDTLVNFEIEPVEGVFPASVKDIAGHVGPAADAAIAAANLVLNRVRTLSPDSVEVKFGMKVTGTADWLIARASTEGNFEITLTWSGGASRVSEPANP